MPRSPKDFATTLSILREVGVPVAPHVIVGLYFGQMRGELMALEIIRQVGTEVVVLVVLRPLPHTPMANAPTINAEIVGWLAAVARLLHLPSLLPSVVPVRRARSKRRRSNWPSWPVSMLSPIPTRPPFLWPRCWDCNRYSWSSAVRCYERCWFTSAQSAWYPYALFSGLALPAQVLFWTAGAAGVAVISANGA